MNVAVAALGSTDDGQGIVAATGGAAPQLFVDVLAVADERGRQGLRA